jgi:hypothetical protein
MDLETKQRISESMKGNQNAKKKPFTEQMKRFILANPEKMERIIEGVFKQAEEGNLTALGMIADRVEGKPMQAQEISGPDGAPLADGVMWVIEKPKQ